MTFLIAVSLRSDENSADIQYLTTDRSSKEGEAFICWRLICHSESICFAPL